LNSPFGMANDRVEIDVSFRIACWFGMICSLYLVAGGVIFFNSLFLVIEIGFSTRIAEFWYWAFLPLFAFLMDRTLVYMYQNQLEKPSVWIKAFFWISYLIFPSLFLPVLSSAYIISSNIMNLICPWIFLILTAITYLGFRRTFQLV
jgi:hypothetical protein